MPEEEEPYIGCSDCWRVLMHHHVLNSGPSGTEYRRGKAAFTTVASGVIKTVLGAVTIGATFRRLFPCGSRPLGPTPFRIALASARAAATFNYVGLLIPMEAGAWLGDKIASHIINRSYQTQADNIVGKMTIAALDKEMLAKQRQIPSPLDLRKWAATTARSVAYSTTG